MDCSNNLTGAIEALEKRIKLRYKLNDTMDDMINKNPNQKFSAKQLEEYLTKNRVSPKEIKVSYLITP